VSTATAGTPADSGQTTDHTYTGPTPGSGAYGIFQATAQQAFDAAQQQLGAQRTSFLHSQGLLGQYDPNGAFTGHFTVDANNPGGAYQQMQQGNAAQGEADQAAIAGTGLGGGLGHQMQEQSQQGLSQHAAAWASGAGQQFDQFSQQGVANETGFTNSLFGGLQQSIQDAIANGTYNPADYSGISIGGTTFTPPSTTPAPPLGGAPPPTGYGGGTGGAAFAGWKVGGKTV
jgi:hypothetical protein